MNIKNIIFHKSTQLLFLIILNCLGSGVIKIWGDIRGYGLSASIIAFILSGIGYYAIVMIFITIYEENNIKNTQMAFHDIASSSFNKYWQPIARKTIFWIYIMFVLIGNASFGFIILESLFSMGLISYLSTILSIDISLIETLIYILIYALIGCTGKFDISQMHYINAILAIIKIFIVFILPLISILMIDYSKFYGAATISSTTLLMCMFKTIWPFVGLECIMMEDNVSTKHLKSGILYGIIICTLIYCLNAFIIIGYIPHSVSMPYEAILTLIFPNSGYVLYAVLLFLSFASLYGWTYSAISSIRNSNDICPAFLKNNNFLIGICAQITPLAFTLIIQLTTNNTRSCGIVFDLATILLLSIFLITFIGFAVNKFKKQSWKILDILYFIIALVFVLVALQSIIISIYIGI